ncbi:MAG: T9SS type A sorting domain-containing protein [Flavobacteriales bacterium]
MSTSPSGIPYAGPEFNNNGTVNATLKFEGGSAQQLNGTGTITSLTINRAAGVDLGGDQTVTNTLTMTIGQLRMGDNDLFVENNAAGAVAGGSSNSWVVNSGTGSLHRQVIGSGYLFHVGTTSYTPLLMNLFTGPQDRSSARVQDGVSTEYSAPGEATGSTISSDVVGRTWIIGEQTPGGQTLNLAVVWNVADELSLFNRNACRFAFYDGTNWVPGATAVAFGTGPFTRSFLGLTNIRELCVADTDAALNDFGTNVMDVAESGLHVYPVPADDIVFIDLPAGSGMHSLMLFDASGRAVMQVPVNSAERLSIPVQQLQPGIHKLVLVDAQGQWHRQRVSIVH